MLLGSSTMSIKHCVMGGEECRIFTDPTALCLCLLPPLPGYSSTAVPLPCLTALHSLRALPAVLLGSKLGQRFFHRMLSKEQVLRAALSAMGRITQWECGRRRVVALSCSTSALGRGLCFTEQSQSYMAFQG